MKTSNKILLGAVSVIVLLILSMLVFLRTNLTTQNFQEDTTGWQTHTHNVAPFQEVIVHTTANVYLTQGTPKLEMHGTEENLSKVDVKVKDGKLIIKNKEDKSFNSRSGKMSLYITTDSLNKIVHSGMGSIESSTKLTFPSLNVRTSGANDASLQIDCQKFSYHQTGVGSVNLSGTTESAGFSNTGAGNMDASNFKAKQVNVNGTGIGSFDVYATEQLNINLSGAGSVHYKGNPRIQQNISGIGSVSAL